MTPHAKYVTERRAAARKRNAPLLRLEVPLLQSVHGGLSGRTLLFWTTRSGLASCDGTGAAIDMRPEAIRDAVEKGGTIVCTTASARDALIRRVQRTGTSVGESLGYQIAGCARLPHSNRVIVLTKALQQKFWAPEGQDPNSIASWRRVMKAPAGHRGVIALARAASSKSETIPSAAVEPLLKALDKADLSVWRASGRPGPEASIRAFLAAETAGSIFGAILSHDEVGRNERVTEGSSATITPYATTPGSNVLAQLSQPCRLRTGREVDFLSPTSDAIVGSGVLISLDFDPSRGLIGEFGPKGVRRKGFSVIERVARTGADNPESFIAAPSPFLGAGANSPHVTGPKWSAAKGPGPKIEREVPFDVVLAGEAEVA